MQTWTTKVTNVPNYARHDAMPASTALADVAAYVTAVLAAYGLSDWRLTFDNAKRRLGVCRYATRTIGLSRSFLPLNGVENVRETVLHEVAHALTRGHGHGPVWRRVARQLGSNGDRTACQDVASVAGRWQAKCPGCGVVAHRHRQPRRLDGWHCRRCGKVRGPLVWADMKGVV